MKRCSYEEPAASTADRTESNEFSTKPKKISPVNGNLMVFRSKPRT